jgi:hypothetical protein
MLKEALRPVHDEPPVQESSCYQRGQGQGERAPPRLFHPAGTALTPSGREHLSCIGSRGRGAGCGRR